MLQRQHFQQLFIALQQSHDPLLKLFNTWYTGNFQDDMNPSLM